MIDFGSSPDMCCIWLIVIAAAAIKYLFMKVSK
jgi:hypothetical protein